MKKIFLLSLSFFLMFNLFAQTRVDLVSINGEQVYLAQMRPVLIVSKKHFNSWEEEAAFIKLRNLVFAVYPYAKMSGIIYNQINEDANKLDKKRSKNKYVRIREEELKEQFEDRLKNLTVNQGKVLIKLINRETGNNCYNLIKEFKNPVVAAMWNLWAKKYGYNLKEPYNAADNKDLEFIMKAIEDYENPAEYSAQYY